MQKTKFQIKGMHCNSCAVLIEEKLKNRPGIIKARTDYNSRNAVVVYDEQKIRESEIFRLVEEGGDYRAERIEGEKNLRNKDSISDGKESENADSPSKVLNYLKILTALVVVSLGLNAVLAISAFELLSGKGGNKNLEASAGQNLPSQGNPTEQPPIDNGTNVQTFKITDSDHVRGSFTAPITLIEFSDFECPFCERHYPTLNKILSDYSGKVRLVYKHFPLGFHPNAQKAAEASECASEQGKFWEYHDKLFENQPSGYSLDKFKQWANESGLNSVQFDNCLDSGKYAQKVQSDFNEGQQKGVQGTPATFVNGQLVSGALPYETFKRIIDNLLTQ